ncbi:MAG: type II secretion system protein GspL [Parvularculaceae bacterium]
MSVLFVYFGPGELAPIRWGLWDAKAADFEAAGEIAEGPAGLAAALEGRARDPETQIVAIVAGEDATASKVRIPAGGGGRARAAAAYALEDGLAEDVDALHVAIGRVTEDGRIAVAAARRKMDAWLKALELAGLSPQAIVPDYALVPTPPDEMTIVADGDRWIVAAPGGEGFAIEARHAATIAAERAQAAGITRMRAYIDALQGRAAFAEAGVEVDVHPALDGYGILAMLAAGFSRAEPVNLMQGEYRPPRRLSTGLRVWRGTAALAAASAAAFIVATFAESAAMRSAAARVEARAEEIYRAAFPEERRIVNLRAQIRAKAAQAGAAGSDFLALAELLAAAVRDIENVRVESMHYDSARAEISAEILLDDFSDAERLRTAATARGAVIEDRGMRRRDDGVVGDITLRLR